MNNCPCGVTVEILVKIPPDLSYTGRKRWKKCKIDKCIAPLVQALQLYGIDMRGSCCGHGKQNGNILLQDGKVLTIKNNIIKYCNMRD